MILPISRDEISILLFNMKSFRKEVKKGFKKTYKNEQKELMNTYDYVIDTCSENLETGKETTDLLLFDREANMIESFIYWLSTEIKKMVKKLNNDDKKMIQTLEEVRGRLLGIREEASRFLG